jgi:hypothetical protein
MLKHYNEEAVKTMAKAPEELEEMSNKTNQKHQIKQQTLRDL